MRPLPKALIGLLVVSGFAAKLAAAESVAAPPTLRLAEANGAFALDLYAKLKSQKGNLFFSPYSVATCLRMVNVGARGQTREQLCRILHTAANDLEIEEASGRVLSQLAPDMPRVELRMANGLWAQKGDPFKEEFLGALRRDYAAELQRLDFRGAPAAAAEAINRWAAKQTQGKITSIVNPSQFSPLDALVLANAIYFKADWERQFSEAATSEAPFQVTKERSVPVKLMTQTGMFPLVEPPDLQVLELAYVGQGSVPNGP